MLGGSLACVVFIHEPGILPAALRVWGMIFANGLPVQAVPGYFCCQNTFAPGLIDCRVKQRNRVKGKALNPPAVYLHLANIK